jgi:hypothetical protein
MEPAGRAISSLSIDRRAALGYGPDAELRHALDNEAHQMTGYLHAQQRASSAHFACKALAVFQLMILRIGSNSLDFVRSIITHSEVEAYRTPTVQVKVNVLSAGRLSRLSKACSTFDVKPLIDMWINVPDVPGTPSSHITVSVFSLSNFFVLRICGERRVRAQTEPLGGVQSGQSASSNRRSRQTGCGRRDRDVRTRSQRPQLG